MPDQKISVDPAAADLSGCIIPVVTGGINKQAANSLFGITGVANGVIYSAGNRNTSDPTNFNYVPGTQTLTVVGPIRTSPVTNEATVATPANGMIIYSTALSKFRAYENGAWVNLIGGAAGAWPLTGTGTLTGNFILNGGSHTVKIGDIGGDVTSFSVTALNGASLYGSSGLHGFVADGTGIKWVPDGTFDAQGDTYYRLSTGYIQRIPIGANTYVLTSNGIIPSWQPAAGGGWPLTGTGTFTGAVTIDQTTTSGNILKFLTPGLGVTPIDGKGLWIQNATAAAAGAQQISGSLLLEGQGWATTPVASQSVKWKIDNLPIQGAANPTTQLRFASSVNGSAYTTQAFFLNDGSLNIVSGGNISFGGTGVIFSGSGASLRLVASNAGAGVSLEAGATSSAGQWVTYINGGALTMTSGVNTMMMFRSANTFAPTSGTATYAGMIFNHILNTTGTYVGIGYGIDYNPTLTSVTGLTHIASRWTSGSHLFGGTTITANTMIDVRGLGTTTNNILRLADSGNATRFTITDIGLVNLTQGSQSTSHTFALIQQGAHTGGSPVLFQLVGGSHTTLSGEALDIYLNLTRTVQFNTGAQALLRSILINLPIYSFVGASTITDAVGVSMQHVKAGDNATITNQHAFRITSGSVLSGTGIVTNSYAITASASTGASNNYAAQFLGGNVGIGLSAPLSALDVAGSFGTNTRTITTSATLAATDHTVLCDSTGGVVAATLPTASGAKGRIYVVKKIDASANNVTLATVDGGTKTITTRYSGFAVQSDGSLWYVIASF